MERNARSSIGRQAECDVRRRSGEATFKHGGRIAARGAERDSSCCLRSARVLPGRKALDGRRWKVAHRSNHFFVTSH
jgi:hypothetical protein